MEFRKLTKQNLKDELSRVEENIIFTGQFLQNINEIPEEQIQEIQKIKVLMEKSKLLDKKDAKIKYSEFLKKRQSLLKKAIEEMEKSGAEFYNE